MIRKSFVLFAAVVALAACREQLKVIDTNDQALAAKNGLVVYQDKPFTGIVRSRIPALQEIELTEYRLGIQHGVTRKLTDDGKLLAEWPYVAGAKHGAHKTWDREGRLRTYATFRMGNYVGESWAWFPDGKTADYQKYSEKGELLVARRWRPTGQIYMNQVFKNGAAIGMPGSKLCDPTGTEKNEAENRRRESGGVQ
jgi:antitoxin component YwqK of YwqJK toxin-antitoxin module